MDENSSVFRIVFSITLHRSTCIRAMHS